MTIAEREPLPGEGDRFVVEEFQTREEWLAAGHDAIGGSAAPALWSAEIDAQGEPLPYQSPYAYWCAKRGLLPPAPPPPPPPSWSGSLADGEAKIDPAESGTLAEDGTRELFSRKTGAPVVYPGPFVRLRSLDNPRLAVSLDGVVADAFAPGAFEAKERNPWMLVRWREGLPLTVQIQLAHALMVTGWAWGVGVGRMGRFDLIWRRYDRDDEFLAAHLLRCEEMLSRIDNGDPPPLTGHPADLSAVSSRFAKDDGTEIAAPDSMIVDVSEWERARAEQSTLAKVEESAEARIREAMADHSRARLPDGRTFKLQLEKREPRVCACGREVQKGWEKRIARLTKGGKAK